MRSSRLLPLLLATATTLCFIGPGPDVGPSRVARRAAPPRTKPRVVYYKALTKINIRVSPEVRSLRSGKILEEGQQFQVEDTIETDGQTFLKRPRASGLRKLTNGDGWVFSKGIAGKWVGKTIAEPLVASEDGPDSSNEVIKAIKKAIREPLKELERDPAFYAYIGAVLGVFVLIFRMFANV